MAGYSRFLSPLVCYNEQPIPVGDTFSMTFKFVKNSRLYRKYAGQPVNKFSGRERTIFHDHQVEESQYIQQSGHNDSMLT